MIANLLRITTLLAEAIHCDITSLLPIKALLQSILFPIISVISLILLRMFASVTICTTCATRHCNKQSIWSKPTLSLHSSFLSDERRDDLIRCGTHYGVFVHQ